ncbi:MAG TPA: hypothetical protein VFE14_14040 [Micromonosporaceae bacterium]|nr:hypothetical protein [Micromonosporaceae bacterium]
MDSIGRVENRLDAALNMVAGVLGRLATGQEQVLGMLRGLIAVPAPHPN